MARTVTYIYDDNIVHTITINSVSNYSVDAYMSKALVSFLVDTRAVASLICGDIWDIWYKTVSCMHPVGTRLVGVDSIPL